MGNKSSTKIDKFRQIIQTATKTRKLFPEMINQQKKLTVTWQSDLKLPSSFIFKSSDQIQKNILNSQQIKYSTSIYSRQHVPVLSLHDNWPNSCIGLVLCEHNQNNQTNYVYGTGILIHEKVVLTSAQNVYCRRIKKQYTNIRFIIGVSGKKCSGIYDVMRVHYPNEYTMQQYDNYNFAVLQLYDDLCNSCGYIGLKIMGDIKEDEKYTEYGYTNENQQGYFNLRQRIKNGKQQQDWEDCHGSGVLIKEIQNENKYYMVGLRHLKRKVVLNDNIRKMINKWTELIQLNIQPKQISLQLCMYLSQVNFTHLTSLSLIYTKIGAQGCKHLSQANWKHLTKIYLPSNSINAQGCKYLSQANWNCLTTIYLSSNIIDSQGCKYLSQANWTHLTTIDLTRNSVNAQGCKFLSQSNFTHLTSIILRGNNICVQGCKYLRQANWIHLTTINLVHNNIGAQGCKYLSQANWIYLTTMYLVENNINDIIYRLLQQSYPKAAIYI